MTTTNTTGLEKKISKLAAQVAIAVPAADFKARRIRANRLRSLAALKTELAAAKGSSAFYGVANRPDGSETIVCIPGRD